MISLVMAVSPTCLVIGQDYLPLGRVHIGLYFSRSSPYLSLGR
jgi:hypothetical protein